MAFILFPLISCVLVANPDDLGRRGLRALLITPVPQQINKRLTKGNLPILEGRDMY